jgi:hypothetical protein
MDDIGNTFSSTGDSNRTRNAFVTEARMLPSCVFPLIYNSLEGKSVPTIASFLRGSMLLSEADALYTQLAWSKINFDAWDNPYYYHQPTEPNINNNIPYSLPYDEAPSLNPQFFSPVCRCLNEVMKQYRSMKGSFVEATNSIKACIATQHHIQRQTLAGNDELDNSDMTRRKYISRHSLLFNLCLAMLFTMAYNSLRFNEFSTDMEFFKANAWRFALIFGCFAFMLFSPCFSLSSVSPENSMPFNCIVYFPAAAIFLAVELMWGHVAKDMDIRRQTYLHPFSFYVILVNLHLIALIENGVFTFHVIMTFVFLSNITTLSYTAVLFIAHGKMEKMWEGRVSELKGYILVLVLVGSTMIFHGIPAHPMNSELNFLWMLPSVFVMFCFIQVVFLEHLMDAQEDSQDSKLIFTDSVHLLNTAHMLIITAVIVYYAAQMHYIWNGDMSMLQSGGRLSQRLNFELAELSDTPSYHNLAGAQNAMYRSS